MSYQVRYSETNNPQKTTIVVEDQTRDTSTSLTFVGKNYAGYAQDIAENFLHLLENFAKNSAPANPVEGQLWYDNSADVNSLKVYDGTQWVSAGAIKKSATAPGTALQGDLWADTNNQQLLIYSGSAWLLVGPQFSSGSKTGPTVETIVDTTNISHNVLSFYANNNRIAIISKETFSPKAAIAGYVSLGQGINLSTVDESSASAPTKFWGTASKSDALNINGAAIGASNFLRSDVSSTTNAQFNIRSNSGLSLGSDLSLNIGTESDGTASFLYSKNTGSSIDFHLTNSTGRVTALHLASTGFVGVGPDNTNPQAALDVNGSAIISNNLTVLGDSASTSLSSGSLQVAGGIAASKSSTFGSNITTYGQLFVNYLDINADPTPASVILSQPVSFKTSMFP